MTIKRIKGPTKLSPHMCRSSDCAPHHPICQRKLTVSSMGHVWRLSSKTLCDARSYLKKVLVPIFLDLWTRFGPQCSQRRTRSEALRKLKFIAILFLKEKHGAILIRTKHILAWAFFSFSRVYLFNIFLHISFHLPEGWLARSRIKNVNLGLSLIPPRHRESRRMSRRMLPLKATKSFYFELK